MFPEWTFIFHLYYKVSKMVVKAVLDLQKTWGGGAYLDWSRHRWGQVARVCPGVRQMPHVRGLLAAGGLSALTAPVILLAWVPPFPPPLHAPPKAPDRVKTSQRRRVS